MIATARKLAADGRAVASIELALVANLLLVPLTMGAMDAGQLFVARAQLDQVLHQALFYAYGNNGSVTASNIQTYAAQAYGTGTAPSVTATITQYCITPAIGYPQTGTPTLPVSGACTNNAQSLQSYVSVSASVSVSLMFSVPWIAQTTTVSVAGRARIS